MPTSLFAALLLLISPFAAQGVLPPFPSLEQCRRGVEFGPGPSVLFTNLSVRLVIPDGCTDSDYDEAVAELEFHPDTLNPLESFSIYPDGGMVTPVGRKGHAVGTDIHFDCTNFVRPGYYRAVLQINRTSNRHSHSEWRFLSRGDGWFRPDNLPRLRLQNHSIFPQCSETLNLRWYLPSNCRSVADMMDFRIRVLASTSRSPSNDTPDRTQNLPSPDWLYLEELPITNGVDGGQQFRSGQIAIPCMQFDILHEQFCFELVSVERQTRHFELWDRQCVDTEPRERSSSEPNSWWAEWSPWSRCDGRECERSAYRKRWRACRHKNQVNVSCTGSALELDLCNTTCRPGNDEQSTMPMAASAIGSSRLRNENHCDCGCNLTGGGDHQRRLISFFAGSRKCEASSMVWTSRPHGGYVVSEAAVLHLRNAITRLGHTFAVESDGESMLSWSRQQFGAEVELAVQSARATISLSKSSRTKLGAESGVYVTVEYRAADHQDEWRKGSHAPISISRLPRALASLVDRLYDCDVPSTTRDGSSTGSCDILASVSTTVALLTMILAALLLPPVLLAFCTAMILPTRHRKSAWLNSPAADRETEGVGERHTSSPTLPSSPTQSLSGCTANHSALTSHAKITATALPVLSQFPQVAKRSIGIQLSRQSTPHLALKSAFRPSRHKRHANNCFGAASNASLTSANTVDGEELEYDYSFLQPELATQNPITAETDSTRKH